MLNRMPPEWTFEPEMRAEDTIRVADGNALVAVNVPSVLRCACLITWVKVLLLTRGLPGAVAWIRIRVAPVPQTVGPSLTSVKRIESAVAMAGALYPGRAKCLEQSLVLYYLLRSQGVGANYRQGVQPFPFQAHAWVEYRGEVVNDVPEHARQFTPLTALLP
jgi:hypothetical protein